MTRPAAPAPCVYTLSAVRGRLRRGARSVRLFVPGTGRLITVTARTLPRATRLFRSRAAELNRYF